MTAIGVVRGRPLFRPRIVTSRFGPSGMPATMRTLRSAPKTRTLRGTRGAQIFDCDDCGALSSIGHILWSCRVMRGEPQPPSDVTRNRDDPFVVGCEPMTDQDWLAQRFEANRTHMRA